MHTDIRFHEKKAQKTTMSFVWSLTPHDSGFYRDADEHGQIRMKGK
jgi:hypothetical protein